MKVLVVNPSLFAPFYDYHLCRALSEKKLDVTMVARPLREYEKLGTEPFHYADLFYRSSSSYQTGWRTPRALQIRKGIEHATGLQRLVTLVEEQSIDIVHFQWLVVPLLDQIALRRLRGRCGLVLTVHNSEIAPHSAATMIGWMGSKLQTLGQLGAVKSFDCYVAHSEKTAGRLRQLGIGEQQIVQILHPPLELGLRYSGPVAAKSSNRVEVLFFGSIKPYKGVDVLVDAAIRLASRRRDFRVTIAGRPFHPIDDLVEKVARAGAEDMFCFDLEYISDEKLSAYLTNSDVIVFPYREIDGSGAMSHAILFEKPIIATNVGGFSESPFRDYVELVAPDDPIALAAAMDHLIDSEAEREHAKARVVELRQRLPSWIEYAEACRKAYDGILKKSG